MCGLFGQIGAADAPAKLIALIHDLQRHRGPDDRGTWSGTFGKSRLSLAFQRLAIIDLTSDAAQPFESRESGSVIVFNGEIYNYRELRTELQAQGIVFRTSSDTEVLLAALDRFGIDEALKKLNGMFAFAWLCGRTRRLFLARDRIGEKPLYYLSGHGAPLTFASEIKSLLASAAPRRFAPNRRVLHNFLVNGTVDDSEQTFFEGVYSLPPAAYGEVIDLGDRYEVTVTRYWPQAAVSESSRSLASHIDECHELLGDSVKLRLRSDVPLGFLLSGGIDSSLIAALALQKGVSREQFSGFSVVNPSIDTDESTWISSVTNHLRISTNMILFDPNGPEIVKQLERYIYFHDEPVSNLAVIAQVAMMEAAREQGITVLLSGQGGDELFCGYNKYFYFGMQELLRAHHPWEATRLAWSFMRNGTVLRYFSPSDAARYVRLPLPGTGALALGPALVDTPRADIGIGRGDVRDRQLADLLRFSAPAITHAEDRTSMSQSREVRFPFLDWRLMEFALSLPLDNKLGEGWTKRILRLVGEPLLPPEITWRKDKVGHFSATQRWLVMRGGDFLRTQLNAGSRIFACGFLDPARFLPRWDRFWSGATNSGLSVRSMVSALTLEIWLRAFADELEL